jgi:hypothetical protein
MEAHLNTVVIVDKADRINVRVHNGCLLPLPSLETDVGASNEAHNSIQTWGTTTPWWPILCHSTSAPRSSTARHPPLPRNRVRDFVGPERIWENFHELLKGSIAHWNKGMGFSTKYTRVEAVLFPTWQPKRQPVSVFCINLHAQYKFMYLVTRFASFRMKLHSNYKFMYDGCNYLDEMAVQTKHSFLD